MNLSTVKVRVDELITMASEQRPSVGLHSTLHQGTLGVMQVLYGRESSQEKDLRAHLARITKNATPITGGIISHSIEVVEGALTSIKKELAVCRRESSLGKRAA
jgi:hypothetical protein